MTENTILLIDKPSGITSHDVVYVVRKKTGIKRVGHAGTLDPLATGLLIILVGREATKRQSEFLHQDKVYECTAQLGITTDSYDTDGRVLETADWNELAAVTEDRLKEVLQSFQGSIQQQVPAYSAVKVKGQKLYEKARRGEVNKSELPVKTVKVFELTLQRFQKDPAKQQVFFTILVHCSSGTYIRSLVHDIGQKLGVGATVTALRRTKIGSFSISDAVSLEDFSQQEL